MAVAHSISIHHSLKNRFISLINHPANWGHPHSHITLITAARLQQLCQLLHEAVGLAWPDVTGLSLPLEEHFKESTHISMYSN